MDQAELCYIPSSKKYPFLHICLHWPVEILPLHPLDPVRRFVRALKSLLVASGSLRRIWRSSWRPLRRLCILTRGVHTMFSSCQRLSLVSVFSLTEAMILTFRPRWRHGEPCLHIRHSHDYQQRQTERGRHCTRAFSQLEWQSRKQRFMGALL